MIPLRSCLLLTALALTAAAPINPAQAQDAAPVDFAALLRDLKLIRETQVTQSKQQRQTALQQVQSAAANGERAAVIWEDAIRAVQFDGAAKEGTAFRDWKEKEGAGLSTKEGRNAARLYFTWLGLTLQRDGGATVKDLMPQVINYTKELSADQQAMDLLEETIKREKELSAGKHGGPRRSNDEQVAKRIHDLVLGKGLGGSAVVQWMKIADFVKPEKWETTPGNYDGIFNQIVLPELRAQKDPRVLDYWDMRLKKEAESASKAKLAFEIDKFNNERRPTLLWNRAEDMLLIGQRNRAMTEMFNLIKTYPKHPEGEGWLEKLENLIVNPNGVTPTTSPGEARSAEAGTTGVSPGSLPAAPVAPARPAPLLPTPAPRPGLAR
ncbi:MAG: hypothetical protein JWQ44_1130 [Chthoniobacter sp.]|nr:hypothetical protein [Chthoniobacter sp.]